MTSYLACTTCNADQWQRYGRAMAQTFLRNWTHAVPLRLYTEGFHCNMAGIDAIDLDIAASWLRPWKAARSKAEMGVIPPERDRRGAEKTYTYKTDAVRFSHKVAAIGAASAEDVDVLIWLDADIVTHSRVTSDWLDGLFPVSADIAWLDRARKYPECGFLMFRLPASRPVIWEIVATYQTGAIFRYPETHDSYVIQQVVETAQKRGEISVHSLSGDARVHNGHVFANSVLASRMDHLKGDTRKAAGRSHRTDLRVPRPEPYWQWK